ncbi:MAG TPA: hypothetical protein PLV92_16280, partial [Pirellulaceae bacterium]|nr:hypothetical protein [Pirellulaceae bacterium]
YSAVLRAATDTVAALPAFGTPVSGVIATPGDHFIYTFSGTAGQQLYFDSQDSSGGGFYITLEQTGGGAAFNGWSSNDGGPIRLPFSGDYRLIVSGSLEWADDFRFRLLDAASSPAITLGADFGGQLSMGRESDLFYFDGVRGQRIDVTSISASRADAYWHVFSPTGEAVAAGTIDASTSGSLLLVDGRYLVVIDGVSDETAPLDYTLRISDSSEAPAAATGFGTTRTGSVVQDQVVEFTYSGTAGTPIYFDSLDPDYDAVTVELVGPSGVVAIPSWQNATYEYGPVLLPVSGDYTLKVTGGSGGGDYKFRILNLLAAPDVAAGATVGDSSIPAFGASAFRFTSAAGQRFLFDSLSQSSNVYSTIYNPNVSWQVGNWNLDDQLVTPTTPGPQFMIVSNQADSAANVSFRLLDIATQPTLTLDSVINGTIDPARSQKPYRFSANAGDRLYVENLTTGNCDGLWSIRSVTTGGSLTSNCMSSDLEATIPATGDYFLDVFGNADATVPYSFQARRGVTTTHALAGFGVSVDGAISDPGDVEVYAFNATAGKQLYVDPLQPYPDGISYALIGPDDYTYTFAWGGYETNVVTIPADGEYRLMFDGSMRTTGDFRFRLLDLDASPTLTLDTLVRARQPEPRSSTFYQFSGTAGQRLFVDSYDGLECPGTWALYGPRGDVVSSSYVCGDAPVTLPITGRYELRFSDVGDSTSPQDFHFRVVTATSSTQTLTIGDEYGSSFRFTTPVAGLNR